jgi:hypothetical protein
MHLPFLFSLFEYPSFSEDSSDSEFDEDDEDDTSSEEAGPTQAEKQAAMDKLVPALAPEDYGKMPAKFYGTSQKTASPDKEADEETGESIRSPQIKEAYEKEHKPSAERLMRKPILPRDEYDGVDSDDETDSENEEVDEESEEDKPQVVGDVEIDMEEEEEEFLEFSRQALGISDEQWNEIVQDRKNRGGGLENHYFLRFPSEPP